MEIAVLDLLKNLSQSAQSLKKEFERQQKYLRWQFLSKFIGGWGEDSYLICDTEGNYWIVYKTHVQTGELKMTYMEQRKQLSKEEFKLLIDMGFEHIASVPVC